jgi:hypothetical protein
LLSRNDTFIAHALICDLPKRQSDSIVLVGFESNRERNNDVSNNHAHDRGSVDDASVGR